jgi:Uncharacterized protein conserved in bacteria (DUF2252)
LSRRFWPLSSKERNALVRMIKSAPVRELVVSLQRRDADDPVELLDAAYWVKGCSSLGRLRYAALLRVGTGRGCSLCLIDIKEGVSAAAPRAPRAKMPRDNAVRVVSGAQALSPNLGQRMLASRLLDKAVIIRELMPQDLKIVVDRLTQQEAMTMARYLAGVVGRAHGRQMDTAKRQQRLSLLARRHGYGRALSNSLLCTKPLISIIAVSTPWPLRPNCSGMACYNVHGAGAIVPTCVRALAATALDGRIRRKAAPSLDHGNIAGRDQLGSCLPRSRNGEHACHSHALRREYSSRQSLVFPQKRASGYEMAKAQSFSPPACLLWPLASRSTSALISAPTMTTIAETQSHVMKPMAAPKVP